MDTGITFLPSLMFEKRFVKSMKNFESSLTDIFKNLISISEIIIFRFFPQCSR